MASFQWIGSVNSGDYSTAANWQPAASAPPGSNDTALIENPATPITGTGTAHILLTAGPVELEGHFTATYGSPVNAQPLTLRPGTVLTTPMLHSPVALGTNPPNTAALKVGAGSRVVIAGNRILDNYAIQLAGSAGTDVTLLVEGAGAVVNGGNLPMSVGQEGNGVLTIKDGGVVSVGNGDPLIYPWCLVIGNHPQSFGTVEVQGGSSLFAHGQIIVGRKAEGTMWLSAGGLVVAGDMAIGWACASNPSTNANQGIGAVEVKGQGTRLIVENQLEVQHMGVGSLAIKDGGFVSVGIGVIVNGTLLLVDGTLETTALYNNATLKGSGTIIASQGIDNGGTITVDGSLVLIGDIDNSNLITVASGGDLQCFGAVTDSGGIGLQENSVASLEAVTGQTITFGGLHGKLVLRSPSVFSGSISGFAPTNEIVLYAEATSLAYSTSNKVLTVNGAGPNPITQLNMIGDYAPGSFHLVPGFPSVITV